MRKVFANKALEFIRSKRLSPEKLSQRRWHWYYKYIFRLILPVLVMFDLSPPGAQYEVMFTHRIILRAFARYYDLLQGRSLTKNLPVLVK